jgi:hypothetical protein
LELCYYEVDPYLERKFGAFNITIHLFGVELLNLLVYFAKDNDEEDTAVLVRNILQQKAVFMLK